MSLSIALSIPFAALLAEDDATIATYFQLLDEQAQRMEESRGR